ncbi:MAG: BBP7 family outer membrane beta-barrel protein [Planctomycetes bacterium]|nr:BBP7 family outer membrane beta-barrel protein [Planctomycetota bacterium]
MRTGCLGLLVLFMTGALGADVRAQSAIGSRQSASGFRPASVWPIADSRPPIADVMPQADAPRPARAGAPGTGDSGSGSQAPSACEGTQQQQQQADPQAQREAELAALRRDHYGPREGMWFEAGPLLWWIKQAPAPGALVSTGSPPDQGILGAGDARPLFGTDRFDFEHFIGVQAHAGTWLNCLHNWGIDFGGFLLEQRAIDHPLASDATGNALLARPFVNAVTAAPLSLLVSSPGALVGRVDVHTDSQFWGSEVNLIRNLASCEDWHFDALFGFRYLDLKENLRVVSTSQAQTFGLLSIDVNIPVNSLTVADRFFTRNQFYGGQIGGRFERWSGPFFVGLVGKVALGPNHESLKTFGFTQGQTMSGALATQTGGLLAVGPGGATADTALVTVGPRAGMAQQLGNLGRSTTDWFVIVPEVTVQAGMQVTDAIRVSAGYNYLFMNSVARPGSQVNANINPALVPSSSVFGSPTGPNQPLVNTKQETFFAHGLVLNLEFRY